MVDVESEDTRLVELSKHIIETRLGMDPPEIGLIFLKKTDGSDILPEFINEKNIPNTVGKLFSNKLDSEILVKAIKECAGRSFYLISIDLEKKDVLATEVPVSTEARSAYEKANY